MEMMMMMMMIIIIIIIISCDTVKVKGTVVPVHATRAYTERRGIAPLTLTHGIRCRLVVSITPRHFIPVQ